MVMVLGSFFAASLAQCMAVSASFHYGGEHIQFLSICRRIRVQ